MRTETFELPGLSLTDVTLESRLTPDPKDERVIDVFARVVTGRGGEEKPYLLFLQGGPGTEAPRPTPGNPPWLSRALEDYRVVMLDQRGTGRSTPVYSRSVRAVGGGPTEVVWDEHGAAGGEYEVAGPLEGLTPAQQAEYLTHLRADSIVRDAELVREVLGAETWTLLGQSFGGFTSLHYLLTRPGSLAGALITGGLPAVARPIDEVYAATWRTMTEKSEEFYRRFPGDRDRMVEVVRAAVAGEIVLPGGQVVSEQRLRTVGTKLGMQGGMEELHYLLGLDHRSSAFAHDLAGILMNGRNPLYSVVHESCYADGGVTNWAAERTMPREVAEDPTLLAGEHVTRRTFRDDPELRPFADAAEILAQHEWGRLYDPARLAAAHVPVAAAVYADDAYVPRDFSLETAALLPDCRVWLTSEYEHNGLRMGPAVLDHLIGLLHGRRWR